MYEVGEKLLLLLKLETARPLWLVGRGERVAVLAGMIPAIGLEYGCAQIKYVG